MSNINQEILLTLTNLMEEHNPYIKRLRNAKEKLETSPEYRLVLKFNVPQYQGRAYDKPQTDELVRLLPIDSNEIVKSRDVLIHYNNDQFTSIHELHPLYDPLHYVLIFMKGECGYSLQMKKKDGSKLTPAEYYKYLFQIRNGICHVCSFGRLSHEYATDVFSKIEHDRLSYIRKMQPKLRRNTIKAMRSKEESTSVANTGVPVILPASFTNSPRSKQKNYYNAMAITQAYGKADAFLTFTCNSKWREFQKLLKPHEKAVDRPDLCIRVFWERWQQLKNDLYKLGVLGKTIAHIHVIEFQKRGLPHVHVLLKFAREDSWKTMEQIDEYISAEIPDRKKHPRLFAAVMRHMIHRCSEFCLDSDNVCRKGFPKPWSEDTHIDPTGKILYRRRKQLPVISKHGLVTNQNVVPYNAKLLLKYDAHVFLEGVNNVGSVKYLYMYFYKDYDKVAAEIRSPKDEITNFINSRYLCATESLWMLYSFETHQEYPPVLPLPVHLPNEQTILYSQDDEIENILENVEDRAKTMLDAYYEQNRTDEFAATLKYPEFPLHYTFSYKERRWEKRKKDSLFSLGRLHYVHPNAGERFFLRVLLLNVRGATSPENLRTENNVVYETFYEAAKAKGLIRDDKYIVETLKEAAAVKLPYALRTLFASLINHMTMENPYQVKL